MKVLLFVVIVVLVICVIDLCLVEQGVRKLHRIVGTEVPASMTWTNGHTYTSIVKHSANCPCVK